MSSLVVLPLDNSGMTSHNSFTGILTMVTGYQFVDLHQQNV